MHGTLIVAREYMRGTLSAARECMRGTLMIPREYMHVFSVAVLRHVPIEEIAGPVSSILGDESLWVGVP